jgi:micrococcal nuclease
MTWMNRSTVVAFVFGVLTGGGAVLSLGRVLEPVAPAVSSLSRCTVARVIDGDTIVCVEGAKRVRLLSIDSPERGQGESSDDARDFLTALLPLGAPTRLEIDTEPYDMYHRVLAYVWLADGRMANEEVIRAGLAVSYFYKGKNVKYRERILRAERRAQETGAGFWSRGEILCSPEDFRHHKCDGFQ